MDVKLPFTLDAINRIVQTYPTPFYVYDEKKIRETAMGLKTVMDEGDVKGFKNFFAVKALPNPAILKILAECGMGADCSTPAELALAEMAGLEGEQIMFSSNNTTKQEFAYANRLGAVINFDDVSMVGPYIEAFGAPAIACCRYNPGNISFGGVNESIMGTPSEAKYGMTSDQLVEAYKMLAKAGTKRFGLHTMLLSNELDWQHHQTIADKLFEMSKMLTDKLSIKFEFINLGGGLGVPYRPEEHEINVGALAKALSRLYAEYQLESAGNPAVYMENGRYVTANAGYLVTKVITIKRTYKTYIGVDASMSNLMRPGMYGAYHHISVLGKEPDDKTELVDVVGSLCENNDKFAIDRELPTVKIGDMLVIHTTGAHGHAMGFQYNGKLRSAELLLRPDGEVTCIRRAETLDDYFATLPDKPLDHSVTSKLGDY